MFPGEGKKFVERGKTRRFYSLSSVSFSGPFTSISGLAFAIAMGKTRVGSKTCRKKDITLVCKSRKKPPVGFCYCCCCGERETWTNTMEEILESFFSDTQTFRGGREKSFFDMLSELAVCWLLLPQYDQHLYFRRRWSLKFRFVSRPINHKRRDSFRFFRRTFYNVS